MTEPARSSHPALLICGFLYSDLPVFREALAILETHFGPCSHRTEPVPFTWTRYYEPEMGAEIQRVFGAFFFEIEEDSLPWIKHRTIEWERLFAEQRGEALCRRVNLDPGYLTHGRVVLGTTKDYSHRILLEDGIYGELTYLARREHWEPLPWTYRDWGEPWVREFYWQVRLDYLRRRKPG